MPTQLSIIQPALHGTAVSTAASAAAGLDPGGTIYRFGQFTLYPARKLLACGDCPVVLGGRAFDLLVALVARAGEVVSHHDLVAAVWPHAVVEENGLRVHMSALRKALGECPADQYIGTVLGRGYRFVKPVSPGAAVRADESRAGWSVLPPLPAAHPRAARLLGRDAVALANVASHVQHHGDGMPAARCEPAGRLSQSGEQQAGRSAGGTTGEEAPAASFQARRRHRGPDQEGAGHGSQGGAGDRDRPGTGTGSSIVTVRPPAGGAVEARQESQGEQPVYVFGAFRLVRQARQLCLGAAPVRLGGRALALLFVLVERAGEVVSRAQLERLIWPNSIVEDSCLRVQVGALRKALGEGAGEARYIANVPGRGYSFVAPVAVVRAAATQVRVTGVPGRDAVLRQLRDQLRRGRLATVVGHGGIGQVPVALCLASALRDAYPDGACCVDLALLSNGVQIPDALAAGLGLALAGDDASAALERWLVPRRLLLLLDNCEHLIEAATALAERVLRIAPGIDIVATSSAPPGAGGECVPGAGPLACAPADPAPGLLEAMRYPAL